MNSGQQRRRSKDSPPSFSTCSHAFIDKFEENKQEMKNILMNIKFLCVQTEDVKKKTVKANKGGQIASTVGCIVGVAAAPFTGGLSLTLLGAGVVTAAIGTGTSIGSTINAKKKLRQYVRRIDVFTRDFRRITDQLQEALVELRTACEPLERHDKITQKIKEVLKHTHSSC